MIIDSSLRLDPASPVLAGESFDIRTGKASAVRGEPSFALRATGEGVHAMLDNYRYERAHARGVPTPCWVAEFRWKRRRHCSEIVGQPRPEPAAFAGTRTYNAASIQI